MVEIGVVVFYAFAENVDQKINKVSDVENQVVKGEHEGYINQLPNLV